MRNSWGILRYFSQRNSWEFPQNTSPEIPEKFSGLGHQVYGFLGELNVRINYEKLLEISAEFSLKKFLRIFRSTSPEIPKKFSGLGHQIKGFLGKLNKRHSLDKFLRATQEFCYSKFLRNSPEIPENFISLGHHINGSLWEMNKFWEILRNSWEFLQNISPEIPEKF